MPPERIATKAGRMILSQLTFIYRQTLSTSVTLMTFRAYIREKLFQSQKCFEKLQPHDTPDLHIVPLLIEVPLHFVKGLSRWATRYCLLAADFLFSYAFR